MTMNDAVICARVLVSIGGAGRQHRIQDALQDIGCIRGTLLHDIMRERNRQAFCNQSHGLFSLRRSDQVGGAEFVVTSPSSPVREFFQPTAEVFFICHGRARTALTQCLRDGSCHRSKRDQTYRQDSHVPSAG
jgi:hypothetical protein